VGISVGEGVVGLYVGLYVGSGVGLRVLGFLVIGFLVTTPVVTEGDDRVGLRVGFFFGGGVVVLVVVQCAGVSPHQPNCVTMIWLDFNKKVRLMMMMCVYIRLE
jgi:hypothetical protein